MKKPKGEILSSKTEKEGGKSMSKNNTSSDFIVADTPYFSYGEEQLFSPFL